MVLRSMLYVPGNNLRMITKAATLASDAIILDLEDAVPLADKATARILTRDSIRAIKYGGPCVFVRVNALITNLTVDDLGFVCIEGLDGIMLAKTETRSDVVELDGMIERAEKASGLMVGGLTIVPLIESAKGVMNANEIASASERVAAVAFGAGDYYRDLGLSISSLSVEQTELLYARCQVVNGSRAAGVQAIDTVFFGLLTDKEMFMKETTLALQLGFKGKQLIHPDQIDFVNKTFSPSEGEVAYARGVVDAFEKAQSRGVGAISFQGKLVDIMNYRQAKDLVDFAALLTEREKRQLASTVSLCEFFATSPTRRI